MSHHDSLKNTASAVYFSRKVLTGMCLAALLPWGVAQANDPYPGAPGARSALVFNEAITAEELFLGGNFIELGISRYGDFGTRGDRPEGFFGTDERENIGMSVDHDGFNNGEDLPVDYFLPGSPEERFAFGYRIGDTTESRSNSDLGGGNNLATTLENLSTGDILSARIVTTWEETMRIQQVVSFRVNDKYFRNDVTITNLSNDDWDSARYMRSFDPDNSVDVGGEFETDNTVTATVAVDGYASVTAETFLLDDPLREVGFGTAPIVLYSSNPSAVASVFGFTNTNPYFVDPDDNDPYENPRSRGDTLNGDVGITLTWDSGPLAAGQSASFTYYTSLDERDFAEVLEDIQSDETEIEEETARRGGGGGMGLLTLGLLGLGLLARRRHNQIC